MTGNVETARTAVRQVAIGAEDDAVRLDRWLRRRFPDIAYSRLAKWLRTGQIRVDGRRARPGQRLSEGQTVRLPPLREIERPAAPPPRPLAETVDEAAAAELRKRVLYRDDALIALNKPSGLAVQGGSKIRRHLDAMLDALRFGAPERPRLVHRLDKDTSGVLLLARDGATARRMTALFRSRAVDKLYWALVAGVPGEPRGRIDVPLRKTPGRGGEKVRPAGEAGQRAVTDYEVVDRAGKKAAWLALRPLTGRTHQLRVHCRTLGTPIVGDGKYGGKAAFLPGISNKLHLHARAVTFPHPVTGQRTRIVAPLADHCAKSWALLGFRVEDAAPPAGETEATSARAPNRAEVADRRPPGRRGAD